MNVPGAFGKRVKCACCNNPWSSAEETNSTTSGIVCVPCMDDDKGYSGINPNNFDLSVNPADNFYLWSNGNWMKTNPIPAEYPSWNTFMALHVQNQERLKQILEELSAASGEPSSNANHLKLSNYYNSFMNEDEIKTVGIAPLSPVFDLVANATRDPTLVVAQLHAKFGVSALFKLYSSPDKKNSEHSLCNLYQGGLGLPDKDYYFDADKAEKRQKYQEYIKALLHLYGNSGVASYADESVCAAAAAEVVAFETALASAHLTRTESRDPEKTFNKMTLRQLVKSTAPPLTWSAYLTKGCIAGPFDWFRYFELIGKPEDDLGYVNAAMVDALKKVTEQISSPSLRHYLAFHVANEFAPHLSEDFTQLQFQFYEKELKGTAEIKPRWKRALEMLEGSLGDALGILYVEKYFDGEAKKRALTIVEQVRDVLRERLGEVVWMSESTRAEALKKMEKFRVKIGFTDTWIDFSSLVVLKGAHLENLIASKSFWFNIELGRMNAPTDRERWFMTPQTVNAYYHPSLNEIVFPAAILQPPFFDPNADEAVNFGSLGAVVGHEMTHGFDDQGRKYDWEGNMRDWWAEGDGEEYERRAAVMISQAEQFEVHGIKLKGKLTCGENIADLGGVKLSLRALQKRLTELATPPPAINGFTPVQRLFLAWAQAWRQNVTEERAKQLVTLDPHGPNELRCNGTLSNVAEFFEAFEIPEDSPMFRPAGERVDIW